MITGERWKNEKAMDARSGAWAHLKSRDDAPEHVLHRRVLSPARVQGWHHWRNDQWSMAMQQGPKLEVPSMYKAYVRAM